MNVQYKCNNHAMSHTHMHTHTNTHTHTHTHIHCTHTCTHTYTHTHTRTYTHIHTHAHTHTHITTMQSLTTRESVNSTSLALGVVYSALQLVGHIVPAITSQAASIIACCALLGPEPTTDTAWEVMAGTM